MSVRALCLALAICAGCGRLGFDAAGDGGGSNVMYSDWGNSRHQSNLSSPDNDWEGTVHPDGLVMVFSRQTPTDSDLMVTTRTSLTADFGPPSFIPAASSANYEFGAAWSPDGSRLYFNGSASVPRYLTYDGTFSTTSQPADELPADSFSWEFSTDGREVFYTTVPTPNDYDLHRATRSGMTGLFTPDDSKILALQRSGLSEGWPTLDGSQNVLYFERDMPTIGGVIYQATRSGPTGAFDDLVPINYMNMDDGDPDLSNMDLTLVIGSNRLGSGLGQELFILTRTAD